MRRPALTVDLAPENRFEGGGEHPLRAYVARIWRRRWVIALVGLAGVSASAVYIMGMPQQYRASTMLMIDGPEPSVLGTEAVVSSPPADLETVNAEINVIRSRPYAEMVVERLQLEQRPEFAPSEDAAPGPFAMVTNAVRGAAEAVGLIDHEEPPVFDEATLRIAKRQAVVDTFLRQLEARPAGRSRLIEIAFNSTDPKLAADAPNLLASIYMTEQKRTKVEVAERTAAWLGERLEALKQQAEAQDQQAEKFRTKEGLARGNMGPLAALQMNNLQTELTQVRVARAEVETRLREAERALASGRRGATADYLRSPIIQDATRQLTLLRQQRSNALESLGPKHPSVIALDAQISEAEGALSRETGALLSSIRSEAAAVRAREAVLAEQVKQMERQDADLSQSEVRLRSMAANAEGSRQLLTQLQARLSEITLQRDILKPDARVLSNATVPTKPVAPNKSILLALAAFGSLALGVGLAMVYEAMDRKVRSPDQIGDAAGLPVLGLVPKLPGKARRHGNAIRYMIDRPRSAFSEASNGIMTALLLRSNGRGQSILVTSSAPGEGKSLFAVSLARSGASLGRRVLLIDADLRRPTIHKHFGLVQQPGLSDVLEGGADLEEATHKVPGLNLWVLPCGSASENPLSLLGSGQLPALVGAAKRAFDVVVFDSPPVLPVPDARLLAAVVDQTVFLSRWGSTSVNQALHALRVLGEGGDNIAGLVVTQVDIRRHSEYGYMDSEQYRGANAYYQR